MYERQWRQLWRAIFLIWCVGMASVTQPALAQTNQRPAFTAPDPANDIFGACSEVTDPVMDVCVESVSYYVGTTKKTLSYMTDPLDDTQKVWMPISGATTTTPKLDVTFDASTDTPYGKSYRVRMSDLNNTDRSTIAFEVVIRGHKIPLFVAGAFSKAVMTPLSASGTERFSIRAFPANICYDDDIYDDIAPHDCTASWEANWATDADLLAGFDQDGDGTNEYLMSTQCIDAIDGDSSGIGRQQMIFEGDVQSLRLQSLGNAGTLRLGVLMDGITDVNQVVNFNARIPHALLRNPACDWELIYPVGATAKPVRFMESELTYTFGDSGEYETSYGLDAYAQVTPGYFYLSQKWLSQSDFIETPLDVSFFTYKSDPEEMWASYYPCTDDASAPCIETIRYTTDAIATDKSKFTEMVWGYLPCSADDIKDWCDESYDNYEHCDPLNMATCKPIRTDSYEYWSPEKRTATTPYVTSEFANQEDDEIGASRYLSLYDEWYPVDDEEGTFSARNDFIYEVVIRGDPIALYNEVDMRDYQFKPLPADNGIPRFAVSGRPRMECEYDDWCEAYWSLTYVTDASLMRGIDSDFDGTVDSELLSSQCVNALQTASRAPIIVNTNQTTMFAEIVDGATPAQLQYGVATWMSNRVNVNLQFPHAYWQGSGCGWNLTYTPPTGTLIQPFPQIDSIQQRETFDPETWESTGFITRTMGLRPTMNSAGVNINLGWTVSITEDNEFVSFNIFAKTPGAKTAQSFVWPSDTKYKNPVTDIREGNSVLFPVNTDQGLPITWKVLTSDLCSMTGTTLKALNEGYCEFTATNVGSSSFHPLSETLTVEIIPKEAQTLPSYPYEILGTSTVTFPSKTDKGGLLTYTSLTPEYCTVAGTKVTGVSEGGCEIEATAPETATGTDYYEVLYLYVYPRQTLTLDYLLDSSSITDGQKITLAEYTNEGPRLTWSSTTLSVCSITALQLTAVDPGECLFKATYAGDTGYEPFTATYTITVDPKEAQTLTTNFVSMVGLNTQVLPQKTDQNTKVNWLTLSPTICSITGTTVKGVDLSNAEETRECSLRATAAEISTHAMLSDTYVFDVEPRTPQTFTYSTTPITEGLGFSVPASTAETISLTWISLSTSKCTVKTLAITTINAGDCTLRASNLGTNNLLGYSELFTVTVLPLPAQSLPASPAIPASIKGVATATLPAKTQQNSTITWSSTTQSVCTVSGTTVKAVSPGACTLKAQAPKVTGQFTAYNADVPMTIVEGDPQSLAGVIATQIVGTESTDLPAATQQTSALTWSSLTGDICTVTVSKGVSKVTGVSPGTCQVRGTAAAIGSYRAYQEDTSITIQPKTAQSLTMTLTEIVGTNNVQLPMYTNTPASRLLYWNINTPSTCAVSAGRLVGISPGPCSITASAVSNETYAYFSQTYNITIQPKVTQSITFGLTEVIGTNSVQLPTYTNTPASMSLSWNTNTPSICNVSASKVIGISPGSCSITASAAPNNTYAYFSQTYNITIQPKTAQSVNFSGTPNVITGTKTVSLPLVTTPGGKPIKWSSTTSWACKLSGNVVTGTSPLTQTNCKVVGSATGDATYADLLAANATLNITAKPKSDQPTPVVNTSNLAKGATRALPVTSPAHIVVTSWKVASSSTSICKVSGYTLTALNVTGTCTFTATNAGNAEYKPLNKSYSISVP